MSNIATAQAVSPKPEISGDAQHNFAPEAKICRKAGELWMGRSRNPETVESDPPGRTRRRGAERPQLALGPFRQSRLGFKVEFLPCKQEDGNRFSGI